MRIGQVVCVVVAAAIPVFHPRELVPLEATALLWAVTLPAFQAPDDVMAIVRIRSFTRRIALRGAVLLATGAAVCASVHAAGWTWMLSGAAVAVVAIEPLAWRVGVAVLPGPTGTRVRLLLADGKAVEKSVEVFKRQAVDVTVRELPTAERPKQTEITIRPILRGDDLRLGWLERSWIRWGAIAYSDGILTVTGADAVTSTWHVGQGGILPGYDAEDVAMGGARPAATRDVTDVVVEMAAVVDRRMKSVELLLLLDAESRRFAELPLLGMRERRILLLTQVADIKFRTYQVTPHGRSTFEEMCQGLFPRSPLYRKVRGPHGEAAESWRAT